MVTTLYLSRLSGVYSFIFARLRQEPLTAPGGGVSNAPSQICSDRSRDHRPCIFKMLVA